MRASFPHHTRRHRFGSISKPKRRIDGAGSRLPKPPPRTAKWSGKQGRSRASVWVTGWAAARPDTSATAARVPKVQEESNAGDPPGAAIVLGRLKADTGFRSPAGRAIQIDRIVSKVRSFRQGFVHVDRYNYYIPRM